MPPFKTDCRRDARDEGTCLWVLRLLRNVCAVGEAAATCLNRFNIADQVADLAVELSHRQRFGHLAPQQGTQGLDKTVMQLTTHSSAQNAQMLLVAAQLLANLSVAGAATGQSVWDTLWPKKAEALTDPELPGVT